MSRFDLQYVNPESEFLENAWYVAARNSVITHDLVSLKLLDSSIVFYRNSQNNVVALEDACPHRKLPLSMGKREGDNLQCGYHGLTFDAGGKCVNAPTQDRIPVNAVVRSYPVIEKFNLVWVWMGNPALADESLIPKIRDYGNSSWGRW